MNAKINILLLNINLIIYYHIVHTSNVSQHISYVFSYFSPQLLSSFCISESPPHNIESLNKWTKYRMKKQMNKNAQQTNFSANILLLLRWAVVRPRCTIGFNAINYLYCLTPFEVQLFVSTLLESFIRSRTRRAHSDSVSLIICL